MRKFHLGKLAMAGDWAGIEADEARWGAIPADIAQSIGYDRRDAIDCKVVLWGTGSPYREFLYVDDMADACVYVMFDSDTTDLLNIGTGEDLTIREAAEMVAEVVGYGGEVVWDDSKPDGTPRKVLDVNRVAALGWKPRLSFQDGVSKSYDWFKSQWTNSEQAERTCSRDRRGSLPFMRCAEVLNLQLVGLKWIRRQFVE